MIPTQLRAALGEEAGGVFYLYGADEHRKEEASRALVAAHLDDATRDFNYDALRGSEVDVETLASVIGTPPMMAAWRVVVLRDVQSLASSPRAREILLQTVSAPPQGLALILLCAEPSKAKFYGTLKKQARSLQFDPPDLNDLPGWIMDWSRTSHGREIDEQAARALAQAVGVNVPILVQELEKLATLVDEGDVITREVVESVGTRVPRQDRWKWFDLVGERRFAEAMQGLPVLLGHGETGVGLALGLGTHLLRIGVALDGGADAVKPFLPPRAQHFLAPRYVAQTKRWGRRELRDALTSLSRVDGLLKASRFGDGPLLEGWILERMTEGEKAA